jgi:hypothetical protein
MPMGDWKSATRYDGDDDDVMPMGDWKSATS